MNTFISYSHNDSKVLDILHKHLAQLQREGLISTWTDRKIPAGSTMDQNISSALTSSDLFIALLSPDYLASDYCYENEFETALEMQKGGQIIIIPIIVEPCDWLSTPFKKFKALPNDGKAISTWENQNTAFLDIIQNIRKLITFQNINQATQIGPKSSSIPSSRNYRIQKDFDSIEKMEFVEKTFYEIKDYLKRYIEEVLQIDNIKARTIIDNNENFECLLVNRNKIATESHLHISTKGNNSGFRPTSSVKEQISYSININNRESDRFFTLGFDEYHLFFIQSDYYSGSRNNAEFGAKEISDMIWNEWLESVGMLWGGQV